MSQMQLGLASSIIHHTKHIPDSRFSHKRQDLLNKSCGANNQEGHRCQRSCLWHGCAAKCAVLVMGLAWPLVASPLGFGHSCVVCGIATILRTNDLGLIGTNDMGSCQGGFLKSLWSRKKGHLPEWNEKPYDLGVAHKRWYQRICYFFEWTSNCAI